MVKTLSLVETLLLILLRREILLVLSLDLIRVDVISLCFIGLVEHLGAFILLDLGVVHLYSADVLREQQHIALIWFCAFDKGFGEIHLPIMLLQLFV